MGGRNRSRSHERYRSRHDNWNGKGHGKGKSHHNQSSGGNGNLSSRQILNHLNNLREEDEAAATLRGLVGCAPRPQPPFMPTSPTMQSEQEYQQWVARQQQFGQAAPGPWGWIANAWHGVQNSLPSWTSTGNFPSTGAGPSAGQPMTDRDENLKLKAELKHIKQRKKQDDKEQLEEEIEELRQEEEAMELEQLRAQVEERKKRIEEFRRQTSTRDAGGPSEREKLLAEIAEMNKQMRDMQASTPGSRTSAVAEIEDDNLLPGKATEAQWLNGEVIVMPDKYKEFVQWLQPGARNSIRQKVQLAEWKTKEATKWKRAVLQAALEKHGVGKDVMPSTLADMVVLDFKLFCSTAPARKD